MTCEYCGASGGELLWQDADCRVVLAPEEGFPGFCRVIWRRHVKEMSDLSTAERGHFMNVVFAVESALRELLRPDKMNLASLGNVTPHLHWHVIPRFADDTHFPAPIWALAQREVTPRVLPGDGRAALRGALMARLGASGA
jgi:diadenosine tetraphosphate (Ap4A) HIT family hydrolase